MSIDDEWNQFISGVNIAETTTTINSLGKLLNQVPYMFQHGQK